MKYGCRAHDYGKQSAEGLAQTLKQAGYDAAQLALPRGIEGIESYDPLSEGKLNEIRRAFEDANVEISVLSCYMDLSSQDEQVRQNGVDNVKRYLHYQKVLGARQVGSETSWSFLTAEQKEKVFPGLIDSVKQILEEAACLNAVFAIEPVDGHPLCSIQALKRLLREVGDCSHLKIIFDPVNLFNAQTAANQQIYWKEWMDAIGGRLGAVHVKDARMQDGARSLTPLGKGEMDYSGLAEWLHREYPDIPLIRDEVMLESAAEDLAFMRRL